MCTHAHPVHKSILKEYGLPHTVVEWYIRRKHESLLKEYGLPHTIVEWYIRREHKSLLNVAEWYIPHKHKMFYKWQCVLQCLKHKIDCRREKNVCKQFMCNQTVTFIHCICEEKSHQNDE